MYVCVYIYIYIYIYITVSQRGTREGGSDKRRTSARAGLLLQGVSIITMSTMSTRPSIIISSISAFEGDPRQQAVGPGQHNINQTTKHDTNNTCQSYHYYYYYY